MIKVTLDGEEISLDVEKDFSLDDTNIDAEACRMGKLLMYYGDLAVELKIQAVRAKQHAEEKYSELALEIRSKGKATEGKIKESILTNKEYKEKLVELNKADRYANKVDNFYKSLL